MKHWTAIESWYRTPPLSSPTNLVGIQTRTYNFQGNHLMRRTLINCSLKTTGNHCTASRFYLGTACDLFDSGSGTSETLSLLIINISLLYLYLTSDNQFKSTSHGYSLEFGYFHVTGSWCYVKTNTLFKCKLVKMEKRYLLEMHGNCHIISQIKIRKIKTMNSTSEQIGSYLSQTSYVLESMLLTIRIVLYTRILY